MSPKDLDLALLRKAHELIKAERAEFVCIALEEASRYFHGCDPTLATDAMEGLVGWVVNMLQGQSTLGYWIFHSESVDIFDDDEYRKKIRETRLRWLDWMIAEVDKGA